MQTRQRTPDPVLIDELVAAIEPTPASASDLLRAALHEGQELYFENCQRRIPAFIERHMSLQGAMRRYYPPGPVEIARLALSVTLTPFVAMMQLLLWPLGKAQDHRWLRLKSTVQRLSVPRAHAKLATAVQTEVFAVSPPTVDRGQHEFERCVASSPSFAAYLGMVLTDGCPGLPRAAVDSDVRVVISVLREGRLPDGSSPDTVTERVSSQLDHAREAIAAADVQSDLESVVAGEAARSDLLNTLFTGLIAKLTLGQMKLGAYGIAMMAAPSLYFRWSNGREERIRRSIDGLLPDGPWSLSRAGWRFEWTDSPESIALVIGLFFLLSVLFSIAGYLLAPLLTPLWRRTGLPALSLRRAVEAARKQARGGGARQTLAPEVFAAKVGDLAEVFWRS